MMDVVELSKRVLARLCAMGYESKGKNYTEQLIFPQKSQVKKNEPEDRISEQELRLLFIEEFKKANKANKANKDLFYSIETPTEKKYKFGKVYEDITTDKNGRSASLDMCVFNRESGKYSRMLNIEFKHNNVAIKDIAKDILKLLWEKQNGAFVHLLENTDKGTLCNRSRNRKGVLDKLFKSFSDFGINWDNKNKSIQLIILSLEQKKNKPPKPVLIHRKITKADLNNLEEIFFVNTGCGNITEIKGNGWDVEYINDGNK